MAERAALDVLPGEADRDAVYEQRTDRNIRVFRLIRSEPDANGEA